MILDKILKVLHDQRIMCLEDFELHMIAEVNSSRSRTTGNIQVYKSYMKFTENIFFWSNIYCKQHGLYIYFKLKNVFFFFLTFKCQNKMYFMGEMHCQPYSIYIFFSQKVFRQYKYI